MHAYIHLPFSLLLYPFSYPLPHAPPRTNCFSPSFLPTGIPSSPSDTVIAHPRFHGDGFLQYELHESLPGRMSFGFRFRTHAAAGLLAFLDDAEGRRFAAIVLQRGMVRMQYLGALGPDLVIATSKAVLADDQWHEMLVSAGGAAGNVITVDGHVAAALPFAARDVLLALAETGRLWVGGISSSVMESPLSPATRSFDGCHTDLTVNGREIAVSSAVVGFNVGDCDPNPCNTRPCMHDGVCTPVGDTDFICDCPTGFTGHRCHGKTAPPLDCTFELQ